MYLQLDQHSNFLYFVLLNLRKLLELLLSRTHIIHITADRTTVTDNFIGTVRCKIKNLKKDLSDLKVGFCLNTRFFEISTQ